jgi:pantothenate kinase
MMNPDALAQEILTRAAQTAPEMDLRKANRRFMVGIAGPPAAGKSTLACKLAATINSIAGPQMAICVPMDGFHMRTADLQRRGTLQLKGSPETFDVDKLRSFLAGLKASRTAGTGPAYSRQTHDVVEDGYKIGSEPIAIVEGNYLFLDLPEWREIGALLDWRLFLDLPESIVIDRLFQRHLAGGMSHKDAEQKIFAVDMKNYRLIAAYRYAAERILDPDLEKSE